MKNEEENETNNKHKPGYYVKLALLAAFEILTAYIAIACSPAKADGGVEEQPQQVNAKPSSTPTAVQTSTPTLTPIPTPSPSPKQLPMDVDLGLTDEIKNNKMWISNINMINISIKNDTAEGNAEEEYWVSCLVRTNPNNENEIILISISDYISKSNYKVFATFESSIKLLDYFNERSKDFGDYSVSERLLNYKNIKIKEMLDINEYKEKYCKGKKTIFDSKFSDWFNRLYDDVTYEQIDEFYREAVDREKWFIPSERYVKEVTNSPYTINSPTISRNIDRLSPIRFLINDVSDEEIDGSVKRFSRM